MIVVMKPGASKDQIDHMVAQVESLGLKAHVIVGTEHTVIAAVGTKRDGNKESLESGDGVVEVVRISAPYKVASREVKPDTTVVSTGSLSVGGEHIGVIAGPCSVEDE
ncbi:MAG: 3-deoxy-7-phosphoheptulonate synthase, partial [Pirellulales bacterium]